MDDAVFFLCVIGVSIGGLIAVSLILAVNIRRSREVAYAARLKQLMIERGFSADEIERIVRATPPTGSDREWEHLKDMTGRGRS